MVKICAAGRNSDTHVNFGISDWYSMGETPPIKSERPELSDHLGEATHLRGSDRELFSQTRRKSAVGGSAKPK